MAGEEEEKERKRESTVVDYYTNMRAVLVFMRFHDHMHVYPHCCCALRHHSSLPQDLPITPDMNVRNVVDICTHFLELVDPRMQYFGLFVEDVEENVGGGGGSGSVVVGAPKTTAVKRASSDDDGGAPASGVGRGKPLSRPLQNAQFLGDLVVDRTLDCQPFKLVFKRRIFLKNDDGPSEDPMYERLVYLQVKRRVGKRVRGDGRNISCPSSLGLSI